MYKYTISLVEEHVKHRDKINEKGLQICQKCVKLNTVDN